MLFSFLFHIYRYYLKTLYVIDVSQSVEHDHPHASEFLRKDITNAIDFFNKRLEEEIPTVSEVFTFVTMPLYTMKENLGNYGREQEMSDDDLIRIYLNQVIFHIFFLDFSFIFYCLFGLTSLPVFEHVN